MLAELREMGVGVYATGGETADVGDLVRTIIVDSTVTCRMKRADKLSTMPISVREMSLWDLPLMDRPLMKKNIMAVWAAMDWTSARHDVFAKYLARNIPKAMTPQYLRNWFIRAD